MLMLYFLEFLVIHKLSSATSYLQTFIIHPQTGEHILRSHATGFFIRSHTSLLLVTNWHVVTGLDPANPTVSKIPPPHYVKATVISKKKMVTELSLPLYGKSMEPLWEEHSLGSQVDMVVYPLSISLEKYFDFVDIYTAEDDTSIIEKVARDVFILGYPFSREEMHEVFGGEAPYYIPIWKRGSIASEPALRLGNRVLLIDSLSRAGMSGAPIVIAQDDKVMNPGNKENFDLFNRMLAGDNSALNAIAKIDIKELTEVTVKRFRFLGVYSGTIGSTRLAEVALGKCWHVEVLRELVANSRAGDMPAHAPLANYHYEAFLAELGGNLVFRNVGGEIIEKVQMNRNKKIDYRAK
jgi:hypothetical protein